MPMNEVVILNADTNEMEVPDDNLESCFPKSVIIKLVKRLSRTDKASKDYVSSLFLEALADLIGGYRDALKFVDSPDVRFSARIVIVLSVVHTRQFFRPISKQTQAFDLIEKAIKTYVTKLTKIE